MHVTRARDEDGFSMVELLVVLIIAGIVLAGVATFMQVVMRQSMGTVQRTEATQRGRLVLDDVTRQLRSQVCIDTDEVSEKVSLVSATPNSVKFYTDFSDGTKQPTMRQITFDPIGNTIKQTVWTATSLLGVVPTTWNTTSKTTTLLQNVTAYDDTPPTPFLRYFEYSDTGDPRTDDKPLTVPATGLVAADLQDVARISIAMQVRPAKAKDNTISTRLEDSVHLRTSDPNVTDHPEPDCR
jgi:prepilin-type N-terminal cleavage/methylation domain-containing protein